MVWNVADRVACHLDRERTGCGLGILPHARVGMARLEEGNGRHEYLRCNGSLFRPLAYLDCRCGGGTRRHNEDESMNTQYTMTQVQLEKILDASKPVRYMVFGGMEPRSPQENANSAWKRLGDELGFDHMTVQLVDGQPQTVFTAEQRTKSQ